MQIRQVRNATLKIKYCGITFLIDPWLQDKGTGFSAKAVRPEMQGVKCPMNELPDTPEKVLTDVDCCIVTHLHFDHFTPDYLPRDLKIITQNRADAETLQSHGFENAGFFDGDSVTIGNVTIYKTIAVHGENDSVVEQMGEASGYVFEATGENRLYLTGDTVFCQAVTDVLDQYQPEVIILNCCGATIPLGRLIMDLSDVERVCKAAPEATVIASHLDSVNHATLTADDVRGFVMDRKLRQVLVPCNGESIEI